MTASWARRRPILLAAAVLLAGFSDWLFYHHTLGWTVALFAGVLLVFLMIQSAAAAGGARRGLWRSWQGRVMGALVAFSLLALVEEPTTLALIVAAVGLATVAIVTRQNLGNRLSLWIQRYLHLASTLFIRLLLDNSIAARWLRRHPTLMRRARYLRALAWWIFPLLAGGVFLLLFSIANPIIERWLINVMKELPRVFDWLPVYLAVDRIFLWAVVAFGAYGLLRFRSRRGASHAGAMPVDQVLRDQWFNGPEMIIRCLVVFNLVFGLQSVLDIVYLYGGRHLPPGMDYRDYAHRGAYPLIFTALVAGVFVLLAFRTGGPAHRSAWSRRLVYLWIAQNIFLMVSTIWRLWLYVDACLLTRLRLATMIWIVLVALGFVWIIVKIQTHRSNAWLWTVNAATLAVLLYICAFINFDGFIANFDVDHCAEYTGMAGGPPIEIGYLANLGTAALPALERLRSRDGYAGDRLKIDAAVGNLRHELAEDMQNWRGWTWRRWRESQGEMLATPAVEADAR